VLDSRVVAVSCFCLSSCAGKAFPCALLSLSFPKLDVLVFISSLSEP
jgi:hypothetical protein